MKIIIVLSILIFSIINFPLLANSNKTLIPINHIYSPTGFDTNDHVEVIISAFLPNVCYQNPSSKFTIKDHSIFIELSATFNQRNNYFCAQMIIPIQEVINLGVLKSGQYHIFINNKSIYQKESKITVSTSQSNAVDDYIYANVEYIEKKMGSRYVHLKGYNPSDCFELQKISFINNGNDTFSILPKMVQISDFCPMKMVPFDYKVKIPTILNANQILLHVRKLEGKSVNTLFPNK